MQLVEPVVSSNGDGHGRVPEAAAVGRVFTHGKELGHDFMDWIDLKIQAEKLKFYETLNEKVNQSADMALAGALAALGGFFLLVAAALGLGALLGHPGWGFLIVGAVFVVAGVVFYLARPTLKDLRQPAIVGEERLASNAPQGEPYVPPVKKKEGAP